MILKDLITVSTNHLILSIVINKLKNEKYEYDLELENKNLLASPIHGDKDFYFDNLKDSGPIITQNTLFMASSGCFRDSSTIVNKNMNSITGLGQSKIIQNDTLYDYSNGNKFFDNSIINNINSGITMTSLAPNIGEHILTNSSMENAQNANSNNVDQSQSANVNIFGESTIQKSTNEPPVEKNINKNNIKLVDKESKDIINPNASIPNNPNLIPTSVNPKKSISLTETKKENVPQSSTKEEITFENAKYLKHDIPNGNRRRSARKFIEQSEKAGTNFITIPKKEESTSSLNTNNIPKNTNTNNSNKYIHQSRRGKQSTLNHDTMSVKEPEHKQNPAIHLSKLLEGEVVVTNSPFNTNKKNPSSGFLFGMESRRGHNLNSNLMKNNVKPKK